MEQSHHRPGHGHGHHHEETQLDRIEKSVGLQQGAWEQFLPEWAAVKERIEQIMVSQEVTDALETVRTSLRGAAAKEHDEFLAAMQTQADAADAKMDELQAKIDELIAKGGTANPDELNAIKGLADEATELVGSIVPAPATP